MATASLVLGIVRAAMGVTVALLLFGVLPGILAIIFGFIGDSKAKKIGGRGHKVSLWGVFLGFVPGLVLLLQVSILSMDQLSNR